MNDSATLWAAACLPVPVSQGSGQRGGAAEERVRKMLIPQNCHVPYLSSAPPCLAQPKLRHDTQRLFVYQWPDVNGRV
ncbi:hypothetical protein E2C01_074775 [Portunus trituberculatus]|uniref:Uncharacterized protein n=1 Tax=Portunus trituberculatus TaxID=210409 RepID=A0A5B7ID49_PORTR|nr:hypothetical protein [Portunus trituberculatus]